jgi:hypothetical protein
MRPTNATSRLRAVITMIGFGALAFLAASFGPTTEAQAPNGRQVFRFDTLGDEQLWTDVLEMHTVIPTVSPVAALELGLKVDSQALPPSLVAAITAGDVDLEDPATTIELLRLDAIVGVVGKVDDLDQLTSVGITCALCHSTVDDSFAPGIGRRLDGWPNLDLDVGKIVGLSPALAAFADEFALWGPGKYDPRHHAFDGIDLTVLNTPSLPVVIPPAYGLRGVRFETFTGDGPVSYWNAYVGIAQMGGQGNFSDPRLDLEIAQTPDLVTPKLRALLRYQLSLRAPRPPKGSFRVAAARRGEEVFHDAGCASCHVPPTYTDVNQGPDAATPLLHDAEEVGADPQYAMRSATGRDSDTPRYRTTPLRALWQHPPYFHDGSATDLAAVVAHYEDVLELDLTAQEKADLIEFLKSL